MPVQWVHLGAGETLVASGEGAWVQRPELGALWFSGAMPDSLPATVASTRQLLDGAIAAAERAAPVAVPAPITARRWAWQLVSQWHCAHHSVALLPALIARFDTTGREELAEFARLKLEEEEGHDRLPLADLRALGYDAEALVARTSPMPVVGIALDYARSCVRGEHPVEFLGYVYALERRVLRVSDEWFTRLQEVLPAGIEAASGVRAHATEFDHRHVEESVAFIARLPADDRTRIALGCHRVCEILGTASPGQDPGEDELERWLSPFRRDPISPVRLGDPAPQGVRR